MASIKISDLTAKATMDGTEEILINDSGTSKKMTTQPILDAQSAAETAQTAAETAETNAETAQAAAEAAQTAAESAESTAITKASEASTSASNAASAQTAAESARDSALAAYDNFDDRYLGAKASDPTTDNDGDALVAGALYFSTADSEMKLYTGSAWTAAYVSGAGVLLITNNLSDLGNAATSRTNLGVAIGTDVQAYSSVLQNTTASFTTADETKLDGIEASADVTDTANVTAAGALMDSEVTNLAQVKAFDSADYATAAQGTTADSALQNVSEDTTPQLGGDLDTNGNDINFGDNDRAYFGASNDLQIYHTGSASVISDQGTGNLDIRGEDIRILTADNTQIMAYFNAGAESKLYHAGSAKLATTSTGVDVTGTVTADGLTLGNANYIRVSDNASATPRMFGMNSVNATYIGPIDSYAGGNIFYGSSSNVNDQVFLTGANNRLKIANNGDISFYEDTGTTAKLFWDASTERLGIGTTSPSDKLDVQGTIRAKSPTISDWAFLGYNSSGTAGSGLWYESGDAEILLRDDANNLNVRIRSDADSYFNGGNVGIGTSSPSHKIHINSETLTQAYQRFTNDSYTDGIDVGITGDGDAIFINRNNTNLRLYTNNTERMRIDSSGNLLVAGTNTDPASGNAVGLSLKSNGQFNNTVDGGVVANINRKTNDGDIVRFRKDGSVVGSIGSEGGDSLYIGTDDTGIKFSAANIIQPFNPSTVAVRDNAVDLGNSGARFKDLYLSGGVYVGGTGSANKLDDYEEGSWTPTVLFGGSNTSLTYDQRSGTYTKVGNIVIARFGIRLGNKGSSTGNFALTSLPFSTADGYYNEQGGFLTHLTGMTSISGGIIVYLNSGANGQFYMRNSSGYGTVLTNSYFNTSGSQFFGTFIYRTNS